MAPRFRLQLLGAPTLACGPRCWVLPFERRTQLLVLLALAGSWVGRREAGALLWPEVAGPAVAANLRKTLFRLAALPWADAVQADGGALRFDGETDVAAFESALRAGRADEAMALWQGQPLDGFDDDANGAWTERLRHERERLQAAWRSAACAWLQQDVPSAAAVAVSARLLEADPWDETALQLHLRWLEASHQGALARQVHARFVERVRAELGVAPSASLMALAPAAAAGGTERGVLQPVRMPSSAAGTVDPGFVGRAAELRRIASLLEADDGRLVTLLGPGGVGKTRLARRAAQELAAGFADGSVLVALEDLEDAAELPTRLARELGLAPDGGAAPLPRLQQHLAGRRLLLVLDNFEHLVAAAPVVVQLLAACPGLKVLVTSRVRLRVAPEQLLTLDGMACPEAEDLDCAESFDAVRLFVRAAQRVTPGFRLAGEEAAVIDICARVAGLPLALELAAAWTRLLGCAEIAAELRRGTELLGTPDPARAGRHASLDVVFEQSWRLLSPGERRALARLSLFRGGFTGDAARAVANAAPPLLGALADHSLVAKDGPRLSLHPLVQQFAAARLQADGAARDGARAHAHHFVDLMGRLRGPARDAEPEAMRQLDAEFENCKAAWQWAVAEADVEALARSGPTLCDLADYRGRVGECLALFEEALAAPALGAPSPARAALQVLAAHLLYRRDRYDEAQAAAREALEQAAAHGDDDTRLQALNVLGSCAMQQGRLDEACRLYEEHMRLAQEAFGPHRVARTLMNLALVRKAAGQFELALDLYGQALLLAQRYGDRASQARCLHNLALLHLARGEADAAGARLETALALCEQLGLRAMRPAVLGALVDHARLRGDFDAAQRHATAAMAAAREQGQRGLQCGVTVDLALIALHRGELDAARRALADAAGQALELNRPTMQLSTATAFAEWLDATGEPAASVRVLDLVIEHPATSAPERTALAARRMAWGSAAPSAAPRSPAREAAGPEPAAVALTRLLRRVAAEAGIAHRPLVAGLRSGTL